MKTRLKSCISRAIQSLAIGIAFVGWAESSFAQANTSTVTNSSSPSAISTTTGGSNLTYQSNNTYNNEFGFGPGIFCRTPALFASGNLTRGDTDNYYSVSAELPMSFNDNWVYGGQIGVVWPFGSKVQEYCKSVARQTAMDKEISTQLSMIRACAALIKEGIRVDANKFPLLKPCVINEGDPILYVGNPAAAMPKAPAQPATLKAGARSTKTVGETKSAQPAIPPKIPKLSGG